MKPFITPEKISNSKLVFSYQCEGIEAKSLLHFLRGQSLVAYEMPEGHAFEAAWDLRIRLSSGAVLEFSSACTESSGWQEVGSLNIRLLDLYALKDSSAVCKYNEVEISSFPIMTIEKLIYEDNDVIVECGLVIYGCDGLEIVVAAGVSPGSVTLQAPFSAKQSFFPQFLLSDCRRQAM